MTLSQFIAERAKETYPEPRSDGHDSIIGHVCPIVASKIPPAGTVLDIGCGQGPALRWFMDHGFAPVGITNNREDFDSCTAAGLPVTLGDMHNYFHPDDPEITVYPVDCVFARHVLEHSIAPFYVLHEFHRILKPGGMLYVEVPAPDTSCHHETNPNHYSVMPASMWASLIHRAGFGPIGFVPIQLETGAGPDTYFSMLTSKL